MVLRRIFHIAFAVLFILGCQKEGEEFGPVNPNSNAYVASEGNPLLIGCEGNFQYGNASLSVLNTSEKTISNNVFQAQNQETIGDVLQSISQKDSLIYLTVNNSYRIWVLNACNLTVHKRIDNVSSPRYLLTLDHEKALVSSYQQGRVLLLNLTSGEIQKSIPSVDWTEQMQQGADGQIYIVGKTDSSVQVLDTSRWEIVKSIALKKDVVTMLKSQLTAQIYVVAVDKEGTYVYELKSGRITLVHYLRVQAISAAIFKDELAFVGRSAIHLLSLSNLDADPQSGEHDAQTPYSIYMDEAGIFISDVRDYLQAGMILHYSKDFSLLKSYETGIIPQSFLRIQQ